VRRNPWQLRLEIGKPRNRAHADAAAARFVPRERRTVDHADADAGTRQRAGGRRASRTSAYNQHINRGQRRSCGDHCKKPANLDLIFIDLAL
jgi:hypothetical protein